MTRGIRIDNHTGLATTVDLGRDKLRGMYEAMDTGCVDRVALGRHLDLWCPDDGGLIADARANAVATLIVRAHIPGYPPIAGHVVLLGHDGRGETVSLNDTQHALLLAMADIALKRVEEARA